MRRGPGVTAIHRQDVRKELFKKKGDDVKIESASQMKDQITTFKKLLEQFATKYKEDIKKNPQFRAEFNKICAKIGVDPLSSTKGFWTQMLGIGDFYYELAVQIVDICFCTRADNGGLMAMSELHNRLSTIRGRYAQTISEDDIERSIATLATLGNSFHILRLGSIKMIRSVPVEISQDGSTLLTLASDCGYVTVGGVAKEVRWNQERVLRGLEVLLRDGMCMIDDSKIAGNQERRYWFP